MSAPVSHRKPLSFKIKVSCVTLLSPPTRLRTLCQCVAQDAQGHGEAIPNQDAAHSRREHAGLMQRLVAAVRLPTQHTWQERAQLLGAIDRPC